MTDLDKKVAEAKGWRYSPWGAEKSINSATGQVFDMPEGYVYEEDDGQTTVHVEIDFYNWSTNEQDAFGLVDEMAAMPKVLAIRIERYGSAMNGVAWGCAITCDGGEMKNPTFLPIEPTRAEAICRAYIALKKWEGKR